MKFFFTFINKIEQAFYQLCSRLLWI